MKEAYYHHDISDHVWRLLEPHLSGRRGVWGGAARDNRRFINAVFMGPAHRRTLARFAARVRRLEKYASPFLPLARQRRLGKPARNSHRRTRLRMANDRRQANMDPVIPPGKNRTVQREYGKYIYRQRYLAENVFMKLKRWRGIATRHAKNAASFLASVHIRCLVLWLDIS